MSVGSQHLGNCACFWIHVQDFPQLLGELRGQIGPWGEPESRQSSERLGQVTVLLGACRPLCSGESSLQKACGGASLVAQSLRVCLPMQGTRVRALVWEDSTCRGAIRPVSHNY